MKRALALLALVAGALGCCGAAGGACARPPVDPELHTDQEVHDACERAGKRLAIGEDGRPCPEARPDFTAFCVDLMQQGVPIHPVCLSTITTCRDVDEKCS